MKIAILIMFLFPLVSMASESTCYGTTADGRLKNGIKLPASGKNYTNYSNLARLAGRTYVHSSVYKILIASYADLEKDQPNKVYKYAETGFREGGTFKPHKTHKNGLSVDFMVPVLDESGKSVHLPTHPLNKLGYNIEFDANSRYKDYTIDYEALAAHIVSLDKTAKKLGFGIWRVIFDPELQPNLFNTKYGKYLKDNISLSKKRSWVRHDEHYHVDFVVPCK